MKSTLLAKWRNGLALTFLLAAVVVQHGISQTTSGIKFSRNYTQTTSTYFEINQADKDRLYDFEKVGMKNTTEVRNVSVVVNQNNDITTTINIVSSNLSEPWMTPPSKIVIDNWGIKLFNAQNGILTQDAYTPAQLAEYNQLKADVAQNGWQQIPAFTLLTPQQINQLQQQGFIVQNLSGGVVKATKGAFSMTYDNAGMSYGVAYSEGPKVVSETTFKFQQVEGRTVPQSKTERTYKTTSSGVCYAQVEHTVFANYQTSGLP